MGRVGADWNIEEKGGEHKKKGGLNMGPNPSTCSFDDRREAKEGRHGRQSKRDNRCSGAKLINTDADATHNGGNMLRRFVRRVAP